MGISNNPAYKRLGAPVTDAAALHRELTDSNGCGLPESDVVLLPEVKATRDKIWEEIEVIAEKACKADRIFIYFAGHGKALASDFGLVAWDSVQREMISFSCEALRLVALFRIHARTEYSS